MTNDLMAINALACVVSVGMYGITGNDFEPLQIGLIVGGIQAFLLIKDGGGLEKIIDTIADNKIFFLGMYLPCLYMYFF
jgi:hypothetical protein